MDWMIPWAGAALAVSLLLWRTSPELSNQPEATRTDINFPSVGIALVFAAFTAAVGLFVADELGGFRWAFLGLSAGIAAGVANNIITSLCDPVARFASATGIACATCGWLSPLAEGKGDTAGVLFAAAVGAGAVALWNSREKRDDRLELVVLLALGAAGTILGRIAGGEHGTYAASITFLAATLAVILGVTVGKRIAPAFKLGGGILAVFIFLTATWFASHRYLWSTDIGWCATIGSATAILTFWLSQGFESSSLRALLSSLLWLGVATLTFGLAKGYGMAICTIAGVCTLGFFGAINWTSVIGPLIGLVIYRSFRETYPDASRAFDIGQHYAIVGLAVGMIASMIPSEAIVQWRQSRPKLTHLYSAILGLVLLVAVAGVVTMLGAKGAVGWIVGCGIASMATAFAGKSGLGVLASGSGLACLLAAVYAGFSKWTDLSRDSKVGAMIWCMAILAGCLLLLLPTFAKDKSEVTA